MAMAMFPVPLRPKTGGDSPKHRSCTIKPAAPMAIKSPKRYRPEIAQQTAGTIKSTTTLQRGTRNFPMPANIR